MKHHFNLDGKMDRMIIDSTFKTNQDNSPFVVLSGIDHHSKNILFGLGRVSEETGDSDEWVFHSFFSRAKGKPQRGLSDQCPSLRSGLRKADSDLTHRNCSWHLSQNLARHFKFLPLEKAFLREKRAALPFKQDPTAFEEEVAGIRKFLFDEGDMKAFESLDQVLEAKERWCPAFDAPLFDAGICSPSRGESWNSTLKRDLRRKSEIGD
jgi:hypothetical protein